MRDKNDGGFEFEPDLQQEPLHQHARLKVEGSEWLIHHDKIGIFDQCARDRHTLLHATGKLMRPVVGELGQPYPFQEPGDPPFAFGLRHLLHGEPEADVVLHREPREQRMILEYHDDSRCRTRNRFSVDRDAP